MVGISCVKLYKTNIYIYIYVCVCVCFTANVSCLGLVLGLYDIWIEVLWVQIILFPGNRIMNGNWLSFFQCFESHWLIKHAHREFMFICLNMAIFGLDNGLSPIWYKANINQCQCIMNHEDCNMISLKFVKHTIRSLYVVSVSVR